MMRRQNNRLIFFLATSLGAQIVMGKQSPMPTNDDFSRKVNLALRLTADHIVDLAGDTTTTIDPVLQISQDQFSIRIERNLNYDTLPYILKRAMAQYEIDNNYLVSLTNCQDSQVLLGFAKIDIENGMPPCVGRDRKDGCYILTISFPAVVDQTNNLSSLVIPSALLSLLLLGFMIYQRKSRQPPTQQEPESKTAIYFGDSVFETSDLSLIVSGQYQKMTFREAKLLQFFLDHKNQLLERDTIQVAVWEDEGIIVGRSLDVFVSRLRKLLKNDPKISINNVHGVGYRFEVLD